MADGNGLDENIFVRGNPKLIGENAPRRFLEAVDGKSRELFSVGSGRRELAERLLDSGNPFTARVMVNRVWLHLFGRGIVLPPMILECLVKHLHILNCWIGWPTTIDLISVGRTKN